MELSRAETWATRSLSPSNLKSSNDLERLRLAHDGCCLSEVNIDESNSKHLFRSLSHIKENPYDRMAQFKFAQKAGKVLEEDGFVSKFVEPFCGGKMSVLLLRNFPTDVDGTISPPKDAIAPTADEKTTFIAEAFHLGLATSVGSPFTLLREKGHHLIHTVTPLPGKENFKGSVGSAAGFAFHQEVRAHPYSPSILLLSCLRGCPTTTTIFCTFWEIAEELAKPENAETLETLQKPLFEMKLPHDTWGENKCMVPILVFDDDDTPILAYNGNGMRGTTPEAIHALTFFSDLLSSKQRSVILEPGDALLINNTNTVHSRGSAIQMSSKRWILRTFIHTNPPFPFFDDGVLGQPVRGISPHPSSSSLSHHREGAE